jgi:hypothetical protein
MKTIDVPSVEADLQEVLEQVAAGKPVDPEVKRRVRERAELIRAQILATQGVQNIGVKLIRELRGELPDA